MTGVQTCALPISYDNVQAAPPDLKTYTEVREYGGVAAGIVGGLVGTAITDSPVGGLAGDLALMSLFKGYVDYQHELNIAQNNVTRRNSF